MFLSKVKYLFGEFVSVGLRGVHLLLAALELASHQRQLGLQLANLGILFVRLTTIMGQVKQEIKYEYDDCGMMVPFSRDIRLLLQTVTSKNRKPRTA